MGELPVILALAAYDPWFAGGNGSGVPRPADAKIAPSVRARVSPGPVGPFSDGPVPAGGEPCGDDVHRVSARVHGADGGVARW